MKLWYSMMCFAALFGYSLAELLVAFGVSQGVRASVSVAMAVGAIVSMFRLIQATPPGGRL